MRNLLLLFALSCSARAAFVNGNACTSNASTTLICALSVTAGNQLVVSAGKNNGAGTITSIVDDATGSTNTYITLGGGVNGQTDNHVYCVASLKSTQTLTVTLVVSGGIPTLSLAQYSSASCTLDGSVITSSNASTNSGGIKTYPCTGLTTTNAVDLIYASVVTSNSTNNVAGPWIASGGFTIRNGTTGSGATAGRNAEAEDLVSSTGTYTPSFGCQADFNCGGTGVCVVLALQATGGAAAKVVHRVTGR